MRRSIKDASTILDWAEKNGVILHGVTILPSPSGFGTGLVATRANTNPGSTLIEVPANLLLNKTRIWQLAADDPDLALLLEANGEFAQSQRGSILLFLLLQISHSSPDILDSGYDPLPIGKETPLSQYVQYIQTETSLPLFWPEEDATHLWGTSLKRHHEAKMKFLVEEFSHIVQCCKDLPWASIWFGPNGCFTFEDWLIVDAMWRSRAMELSTDDGEGKGASLVPIMDMANHIPNGSAAYRAAYNKEGEPIAEMILDTSLTVKTNEEGTTLHYKDERAVVENEEITISYGSRKGAAEMIFSYGFLDASMPDARSMMLGWKLPEDDPLRFAKVAALQLEPGIQIYTPVIGNSHVKFVGTAIWAMSVNEEDGLRIVVERKGPEEHGTAEAADTSNDQISSRQEHEDEDEEDEDDERPITLKMYFKGTLIKSKSHLVSVLSQDRAYLVFRARAYWYVKILLEEELSRRAAESEAHLAAASSTFKTSPSSSQAQARAEMCSTLRTLEYELLTKALAFYDRELNTLMEHSDIQNYDKLLEQGLPLPPLSGTEAWARDEDTYNEQNRRMCVDEYEKLLEEMLTLSKGRAGLEDVDRARVDSGDGSDWGKRSANGSIGGGTTISMNADDEVSMERNQFNGERWFYHSDGEADCEWEGSGSEKSQAEKLDGPAATATPSTAESVASETKSEQWDWEGCQRMGFEVDSGDEGQDWLRQEDKVALTQNGK